MALIDEARSLIREHLQKNPKLSISRISRDAGLSVSTGRAIIQGEILETSEDKIAALLMTFLPFEEAAAFIEKHSAKPVWLSVHKSRQKETLSAFGCDGFTWQYPDHYLLSLASLNDGVDAKIIQSHYGNVGVKRVEVLMEAGFVRNISGRIKLTADLHFPGILDSVAKVNLHAQHWTPEAMEEGGFLYHHTHGLNATGRTEVRALTKKYLDDVLEVRERNPGNEFALVLSVLANILRGE